MTIYFPYSGLCALSVPRQSPLFATPPLHRKHLHHLIAEVVDALDGNAAGLGFVEGAPCPKVSIVSITAETLVFQETGGAERIRNLGTAFQRFKYLTDQTAYLAEQIPGVRRSSPEFLSAFQRRYSFRPHGA
jgi:hypothetical protein